MTDKRKSIMEPDPFWDFWGPLLLTLSLYTGIRHFIAEARYIPSGSMLPGLQVNDRLLVEKMTLRNRSPNRGEIIVFNSPNAFDSQLISKRKKGLPSTLQCVLVGFPLMNIIPGLADPACDDYIKRVVAIEGDKVSVNSKGELFLNGVFKKENYVTNYCQVDRTGFSICKTLNQMVPKGHVLVLGDNRRNSWDSRFWPGGPFLPEREILGRAIWRFWPLNRLGQLDS